MQNTERVVAPMLLLAYRRCAQRAVACLALTCATWGMASAAPSPYSQLVVFGDSLSDNGNLYRSIGGLFPVPPYQYGSFTNGRVAVDVMASALNTDLDDRAYGGALTGHDNDFDLSGGIADAANTGMRSQVDNYIAAAGGRPLDARALYMLWGGGNDFLRALSAGTPAAITAASQVAIANISGEVASLYAAGARRFFVPTLADFSYSYLGATSPPQVQQALSDMTRTFNDGLSVALAALAQNDLLIQTFDTNAVLRRVRQELAARGGVLDVPCWTGAYNGAPLCTDPTRYFLFDTVHPTATVHEAMGLAFAEAAASPVPEPHEAAMAVVGALGVAWAVRRQRQSQGQRQRAQRRPIALCH